MTKAKKILIVEDGKPMARALELKLKDAEFDVRVCYDGAECVRVLKKEQFDLMLLDIIMPNLDGFEVLAWLKERGKMMHVIVHTNLSQQEDKERVLALGAKEFIVKSDTTIMEVVERVKRILVIK